MLVFEKYDDPNHPVVLAADRRIDELTRRQRDLAASVEALKEKQAGQTAKPAPRLADILETLPDLGPALASYDDDELVELFDAFNLEARYNHTEKTLALSVAVFPELAAILENRRPAEVASRSNPSIAGAGFEPATSGL